MRLREIGRVELGAKNYDVNCYLDGKPSVALAVYPTARLQRPRRPPKRCDIGWRSSKRDSPKGIDYASSTTRRCSSKSRSQVYHTLFEAFVLVFIVVLVFLQDWRATIIPMIAVPVSLVGTFAVMAMLGFSLNNLSLFGLVLAIGIVVDDAIVVVENVERWHERGPVAARRRPTRRWTKSPAR